MEAGGLKMLSGCCSSDPGRDCALTVVWLAGVRKDEGHPQRLRGRGSQAEGNAGKAALWLQVWREAAENG